MSSQELEKQRSGEQLKKQQSRDELQKQIMGGGGGEKAAGNRTRASIPQPFTIAVRCCYLCSMYAILDRTSRPTLCALDFFSQFGRTQHTRGVRSWYMVHKLAHTNIR